MKVINAFSNAGKTGKISGNCKRFDTGTFLTQAKSFIPKLSSFLLRRYGLNPRQIRMGILTDKATIWRAFILELCFSRLVTFHQHPLPHLQPSSKPYSNLSNWVLRKMKRNEPTHIDTHDINYTFIMVHTDKLALPGENSESSASGDVMKFENCLRILPLPQSYP